MGAGGRGLGAGDWGLEIRIGRAYRARCLESARESDNGLGKPAQCGSLVAGDVLDTSPRVRHAYTYSDYTRAVNRQ